jgi:hypothetical protein
MTFIADPRNRRSVFDPDSGYVLTKIFRYVPKDEAWFDFFFEDTTFLVKSNVSWSHDRNKYTYVIQVKQLEDSFRASLSRRKPAYQASPQEFRAIALPALRDAIVAQQIRNSGDPRIIREPLKVDVDFIDRAPGDSSQAP